MASSRPDRHLAAILAADVVGYSALVERDEAGMLARLAALRTAVIEPRLAEHRAGLVESPGTHTARFRPPRRGVRRF
jgi:class 3 adenylate cyclase